MSDFSDLLQEAEKFTVDIEGGDCTRELPKVDRSIRQVLEASNDLHSKVAQTGAKDLDANLLLGSKGINLPKIFQKLETISTRKTFEPIEPIEEVNIAGILENEVQNCILSAFEVSFNNTMRDIRTQSWVHQKAEWMSEKRKFLNSLVSTGGPLLEVGRTSTVTTMERPIIVSTALELSEALFVARMMEYNNAIGRSLQKPNLIESFTEVANELGDVKAKEAWEMLRYMTELPPYPHNEDTIKIRYSSKIVSALVKQGKKYLEDRYRTYMSNIINENLAQAMRGGVPGTYSLVRSFVGVRFQGEYQGFRDDKIEGRPLWPMVYYCIRCGDLQAAVYCLKQKADPQFQEIVDVLEAKIKKPDDSKIVKLEETVRFNYRRLIRNESDPFKRIVCAVLGCCDIVDEHSEVARTADDYLWLKLSLVRIDYEKDDHIRYQDLQRTILEEYGESHYDALKQPHLYFQMLMLTGQFEAAIEFLVRIERYKVHAVHMGIVLHELYMLAEVKNCHSPLLSIDPMDIKPARRLNFARLIMLYVRKFEINCTNEALHYYYLLRNYTDENDINLFKICVAELAMDVKNYELILGKIKSNGLRTKGLIDQFTNSDITGEGVAQLIADKLVRKGLNEEAIDLYDIANNQEKVLEWLITLLSLVVEKTSEENAEKRRLTDKSNILFERYSREGFKATAGTVQSFIKMKQLALFFDLYHVRQFPKAMNTLDEIKILPKESHEVEECIKAFKRLNAEVCKVIPDVLLATMNMLFAEYQRIKSNEYIPGRQQESNLAKLLSPLRQQAKVIVNFAGLLPYRISGDINAKLVQMEILMH